MTDQARLLTELFAAIDTMNTPGFLGKLLPTAVFRFGSSPSVQGRDAIGSAVDGFLSTISGISHRITRQMNDGQVLVCEGTVTYTRHDGSTIALPFANFFELKGDLISDYRIYVDIAPLYATDS